MNYYFKRTIYFNYLIFLTFFPLHGAMGDYYPTNGYKISLIKPQSVNAQKCQELFRNQSNQFETKLMVTPELVDRVLNSWSSRGDYSEASLTKLKKFEETLDADRTTWFVLENKEQHHAAIRLYEGIYHPSLNSETAKLPMERKFPNLEIRKYPKEPVMELGLLDVIIEVNNGPKALFHHVSKYLKKKYYDTIKDNLSETEDSAPNRIVITAREANAKLYARNYGFNYLLKENTPLQTTDKMFVMEIPIAKFIFLYYGKKIYPSTKGQEDYWQKFFEGYKSELRSLERYAYFIAEKIREYQNPAQPMIASPKLSDPISYSTLLSHWLSKINSMKEDLINEKIRDLEYQMSSLNHEIWGWEPVVAYTSKFNTRIGSSWFGFTQQVSTEVYKFRRETVHYTPWN